MKQEISHDTKLAELLSAYPHLLEVILAMSPRFEKMRNSTIRETMSKFVNLSQVAKVGGFTTEDFLDNLKRHVCDPKN